MKAALRYVVGFVVTLSLYFSIDRAYGAQVAQQVLAPTRVSIAAGPQTKTFSFQATGSDGTGRVTIKNGDGSNLSPVECTGKGLQLGMCKLENALRQVEVQLTRPKTLTVKLNGALLQFGWTPELGSYSTAVALKSDNQLIIQESGVPGAHITVSVTANYKSEPLPPPVPKMVLSETQGFAPLAVSANAFASTSSSPISLYEWNFGDGATATGAVVSHVYTAAGTFVIQLKVTDTNGRSSVVSQNIHVIQNQAPLAVLKITSATTGLIPFSASFDGSGATDPEGQALKYDWDFGDGATVLDAGPTATHQFTTAGSFTVIMKVQDSLGAQSTARVQVTATVPKIQPVPLMVLSDTQGFAPLTIGANGLNSTASSPITSYEWSFGDGITATGSVINHIYTQAGQYNLTLKVTDTYGQSASTSQLIRVLQVQPPLAVLKVTSAVSGTIPFTAAFDASGSTDPQGQTLSYAWDFGDGGTASGVQASHQYTTVGVYTVKLTVTNSLATSADATATMTAIAPELPPPDPKDSAPPLAGNEQLPFYESVRFLLDGPNPVQKNFDLSRLDENRVSVLRGKVFDDDGQPLSAVKIHVLDHSEFGETLTREDGQFDLIVNGGGYLTLVYERSGFLTSSRQIEVNFKDYFFAPDLVLAKLDPVVTTLALGAPVAQSFQGSTSNDASGPRTPTVVLPSGVTAHLVLPDGSKKAVSSLSFRITEYTKGENGPQKMPADLPAGIAYTHAIELSADEAIAVKAKHIEFSKPVSYYVDNFLNIPIGYGVPFGLLNPDTHLWEGQHDGVVLKVLDVQNGIASVDLTGSGQPASAAELAQFNFNDEELAKLGSMYPVGKSLWRVQTTHFTPGDLNFLDSDIPATFNGIGDASANADPKHGTCYACGSVINVHRASLQERIQTATLPFDLWYSSENAQLKVDDTILRVPLTGATIASDLTGTEYDIQIGGQHLTGKGLAKPNQSVVLQWDGKDAYGRPYPYKIIAKATVRQKFRRSYRIPKQPNGQSWSVPVNNLVLTFGDSREGTYVDRYSTVVMGNNVLRENFGLSGWTPSILHALNPDTKTIYFGNGTKREINENFRTIFSIAGATSNATPTDGVLAKNNPIGSPVSIAASLDGGIYFANAELAKIMKIDRDGYLSTVAGSRIGLSSGDGGPAINAVFNDIAKIVSGPDGSLFVVEHNLRAIRKITPDGIIRRFAGAGGSLIKVEDNIPALEVHFGDVSGVVPSKDGTVFVSDSVNNVIYKITTDGIIHRVAGTGTAGYSGDDGSALSAELNYPTVADIGLNQEIYINDYSNQVIRSIDASGNIHKVVGIGVSNAQSTQDGEPALTAKIAQVSDVKVAKNGNLYFLDGGAILKRVNSRGLIEILSKQNSYDLYEPGVNAFYSYSILLAQDGTVLLGDVNNHRIRRIGQAFMGSDVNLFQVASEAGDEIYQFSITGKHLATLFSRTGKVKWAFNYDSSGLLVGITDADSRILQINRDSNGKIVSVTNKYGQVISTSTDANGWLQSLQLPSGDTYQMQYSLPGMLSSFQNPNGNSSNFIFDNKNNLVSDTDALGGTKTLIRSDLPDGSKSTIVYPDGTTKVATSKKGTSNQFTSESFDRDGTSTIWTDTPNGSGSNLSVRDRFSNLTLYTQEADLRLGGGAINNKNVRNVYAWKDNLDQIDSFIDRYDQNNLFNFKERKVYTPNSFLQPTSTSVYDSNQQQWQVLSTTGRVLSGNLDLQERASIIKNGDQLPVELSYDSFGNLAKVKQGDRVSTYSYDSRGFLSSVTDPLAREHRFTNDVVGRTTQSIAPSGDVIDFMYDKNSNLTGIHPFGKEWHQLVYSLVDLFSVYQAPIVGAENASRSYVYNLSRDLQKVVRADGKEIVYGYDAAKAQVTSITLGAQQVSIAYQDFAQNPTFFTNSENGAQSQIGYSGDKVQSWTEQNLNLPNNVRFYTSLSFVRDVFGRISSISHYSTGGTGAATAVSYTYDVDNLMLSAGSLQIGRTTNNSYVAGTQLGSVTDAFGYSSYGELNSYQSGVYSYTLQRDLLGRIIQKTETAAGTTANYVYLYDDNDRLAAVTKDGAVQSQYVYDGNGNRVSVIAAGQTKLANYDKQDRLVQNGTTQYLFNAEGELQQKSAGSEITKYQYGLFGQLRSVQLPSGSLITYDSNGMGLRIGKRVNGVFTKYYQWQSGTQLAAEVGPTGVTLSSFIYATQNHSPDYMIKDGVNYRFVKDHLGSVRFVVKANDGSIAQRMDYDAWGVVTSDTNPGFQPFGFAGGLYDAETKLVRFGARDYDAETGRWTTKDPIGFGGGDTNLYGYVSNDPVNFVDPTGLLLMGLINAGEGVAEDAANYWAAEAVDMNNSAGYRALATVATGFASLWNCENSDATAMTIVSAYGLRNAGRPWVLRDGSPARTVVDFGNAFRIEKHMIGRGAARGNQWHIDGLWGQIKHWQPWK